MGLTCTDDLALLQINSKEGTRKSVTEQKQHGLSVHYLNNLLCIYLVLSVVFFCALFNAKPRYHSCYYYHYQLQDNCQFNHQFSSLISNYFYGWLITSNIIWFRHKQTEGLTHLKVCTAVQPKTSRMKMTLWTLRNYTFFVCGLNNLSDTWTNHWHIHHEGK